jgi:tetratricopeptide (TPR) repeat protein
VKALEKIADINYSFTKKYPEAIRAYQTLLMFRPRLQNADFYDFRVAESLFESGNLPKADQRFIRHSLDTNHAHHIESFYYLGLIRFYQQEWDEAVEKEEEQKSQLQKVSAKWATIIEELE